MRPPSKEIDAWVSFARRYGLGPWVSFVLEALEPLAPVGAQLLYGLEPLLGWKRSTTRSLGQILESEDAFAELGRRLSRANPDEPGATPTTSPG